MSSATGELVLGVVREGLLLALLVSAPPLLASLLVGLVVGALQAATQVQDHAIAFVPKLVAVAAVLLVSGPVLAAQLVRFTEALLVAIPMIR
jgi:flagellar biosynthetic protein FliQ